MGSIGPGALGSVSTQSVNVDSELTDSFVTAIVHVTRTLPIVFPSSSTFNLAFVMSGVFVTKITGSASSVLAGGDAKAGTHISLFKLLKTQPSISPPISQGPGFPIVLKLHSPEASGVSAIGLPELW